MLNKELRTVDEYRLAGAQLRLLRAVGTKTCLQLDKLLTKEEHEKFVGGLYQAFRIMGLLEERMFDDHPDLPGDYFRVFTGVPFFENSDELETEIGRLAKEVSDGLFRNT